GVIDEFDRVAKVDVQQPLSGERTRHLEAGPNRRGDCGNALRTSHSRAVQSVRQYLHRHAGRTRSRVSGRRAHPRFLSIDGGAGVLQSVRGRGRAASRVRWAPGGTLRSIRLLSRTHNPQAIAIAENAQVMLDMTCDDVDQ